MENGNKLLRETPAEDQHIIVDGGDDNATAAARNTGSFADNDDNRGHGVMATSSSLLSASGW
eukprot:CAMPEP_0202031424 /NCGR_PEP_ID=MMETSP0905-20130828/65007_1 /ASSEMBLY_ACC=CAM_ASM_000554 /TAXON_ID=420261 /ORGANISM="Thalassiosira antarctica, Strain CCMP982" /LENGTH=61 /DNA_ID=CAMNT_0048595261 /DNA_START=2346 /DNA_END=2528 /DNA_ORIENTATION=-